MYFLLGEKFLTELSMNIVEKFRNNDGVKESRIIPEF